MNLLTTRDLQAKVRHNELVKQLDAVRHPSEEEQKLTAPWSHLTTWQRRSLSGEAQTKYEKATAEAEKLADVRNSQTLALRTQIQQDQDIQMYLVKQDIINRFGSAEEQRTMSLLPTAVIELLNAVLDSSQGEAVITGLKDLLIRFIHAASTQDLAMVIAQGTRTRFDSLVAVGFNEQQALLIITSTPDPTFGFIQGAAGAMQNVSVTRS